ncbi:DUF4214 domain-containing protein [Massilia sp. 9I]|uniref:DUF4214 domain-containing protein n=1 Tax=Massilia sp. 9I TaxID=2653152 RepID=UPI0012EEF55A|nr:DUF4214 domain-containing protein [Massilia sp. 9I]VXC50457.1 hypothetical protein MASSI9I_70337 [Massilia sp. 9I]
MSQTGSVANVSPTKVIATGTSGPDVIHGSNLADQLSGGEGDDKLYGYAGDDTLDGGFGNDLLDGGDGNDALTDDYGTNTLHGGEGDDRLLSRSREGGLLAGDAGNDLIEGRPGQVLDGGAGNDRIDAFDQDRTGTRIVTVHGGDGDDTIRVRTAFLPGFTVVADGGAGRDIYSFVDATNGAVLKILDFATGEVGDILDLRNFTPYVANPFAPENGMQIIQRGADAVLQKRSGADPSSAVDLIVFANTSAAAIGAGNILGGYHPDGSTGGREIVGSAADDRLSGGAQGDVIRGEGGNDTLDGGRGDDQLFGGDGDDSLYGDFPGESLPTGSTSVLPFGNDVLEGGNGKDTLVSHGGNDVLRGGAGDDRLVLASANSNTPAARVELDGGDGNDRFEIAPSFDAPVQVLLTGGAGSDSFHIGWAAWKGALTITDFQVGSGGDLLDIDLGSYWVAPERSPFASGHLRLEQRGADTVVVLDTDGAAGSAAPRDFLTLRNVDKNQLSATNMALGLPPDGSTAGIRWTGSAGDDSWTGGWLDDVAQGGDGKDTLDGGPGNDRLEGGAGDDYLVDHLGDDTLLGGAGDDILTSTGDDLLEGQDGNDTLTSYDGKARLDGGNGNDLLVYIPLFANPGRAVMLGGVGNDIFRVDVWRRGSDLATATGGEGSDLFEAGTTGYTVTDFQLGTGGDRIQLGALALDLPLNGGINPFGPAGYLRLVQSGSDTLLQYDLDGVYSTHGFQTALRLAGISAGTLTAAHFVEGFDPQLTSNTLPPVSAAPRDSTGGAGRDALVGGAGNDRLDSGAGNDSLLGAGGNDMLLGGAGLDTARYYGGIGNYKITRNAGGFLVEDKRSAGDGSDSLVGVERIVFADGHMALDVDGVAGQAYRIYRAAFDRAPDTTGMGYWLAEMDKGASLTSIAAGFIASREFANLYGSAPTNTEIVSRLYKNILHREPEAAGYAYWLDVLDNKKASLAQVLAAISESTENQQAVAELIANGIVYTPYFA